MAGTSLGLGLGMQRRGVARPEHGYELREDGSKELREDGSKELREEAA